MSRDYYEILGIRPTATDASIRRAVDTAKDQIAADATLSPLEREARLAELKTAAEILCSPAKRDRYDAATQMASVPETGGAAALLAAPLTWIVLAAAMLGAGGLYWQYDRAQTALRIERERVAAEQQEQRRMQELEAKRVAEKQRLLDELRAQREADDKQRKVTNEILSAESQKKQYVADERYIAPAPSRYDSSRSDYENQRQMGMQAWQRMMEERKQQYEDEINLYRARAEVERQKRYVEQREREDQYTRAKREADSRPSRY